MNFYKKIKIDKYWDTYSEFLNMREKPFKGTYNNAKEEITDKIKMLQEQD